MKPITVSTTKTILIHSTIHSNSHKNKKQQFLTSAVKSTTMHAMMLVAESFHIIDWFLNWCIYSNRIELNISFIICQKYIMLLKSYIVNVFVHYLYLILKHEHEALKWQKSGYFTITKRVFTIFCETNYTENILHEKVGKWNIFNTYIHGLHIWTNKTISLQTNCTKKLRTQPLNFFGNNFSTGQWCSRGAVITQKWSSVLKMKHNSHNVTWTKKNMTGSCHQY